MKIVKLSVFALTMGLFIASCGNNETTESTEETPVEETVEMEPVAEETPVMSDSTSTVSPDTVMSAE